ncbi:MAG TPA: hypothetical protein VNY05_22250 [Candidatus Acidoferrales bacterium]|jgi:hypothetical protein|nr:hypothetical protein [Candidatus Acidoferrales bacterium]
MNVNAIQVVILMCCLPMFAQTRKAVAPIVPAYSQIPFDPTSVRLPLHFLGNDIVRLYEAYKALRAAQKTEYETTDQFTKRIELAEAKLPGNGTTPSVLAFVVPVVSEYDADAQLLNVGVECSNPHGVQKHVLGSIGVKRHRSDRTYVGSNAFGAKVNVDETHIVSFHIGVDNPDDYVIEGAKNLIVSSLKNTPDEARRIKSTLSALALCSIDRGEESSDDFILNEATFDNPHEYWEEMGFLNTKLLAIWFFDSSSGKIYAKVEPTSVGKGGGK